MLTLIINGGGLVSGALTARLEAHGHEVHALRLPDGEDDANAIRAHFERIAESGRYYANVYIDLTDGFDEVAAFQTDAGAARHALERRLKELLKALKYGAQHMARAEGGGRIWVLCFDHSVSTSVATPSNPVTNYAAMAAVQCVAKEVAHLDVRANLFMIHPPKESVPPADWRKAKENLHVYGLKYKPQPAEHVAETLHMYAQLQHLTTTGGVIPLGSGVAVCNV